MALSLALGGKVNTIVRSLFGSLGLKAATVLITFSFIALMSQALSSQDMGTFSMVFSAAGLFAIVAIFGQQTLFLRSWGEYAETGQLSRLRGTFKYGAIAILLGIVLVATSFFLILSLLLPISYAAAATAYLVSNGLATVSAHLVRAAVGIMVADVPGAVLPQSAAGAYILLQMATGQPTDPTVVMAILAGGGFLALGLHAGAMVRCIRSRYPALLEVKSEADTRALTASSLKLWGSQILEVSNQYLDVLVVGFLMDPASAGAYFVITRLANAFAMLSSAIYLSTTRHLPATYFARDKAGLESILDSVAAVNLLAIVGGLSAFMLAGGLVLTVFGAEYAVHHLELVILCIGSATAAASFPATALLNVSSNEGSYLRMLAIAVAVRLLGFAILIPLFAVTGATLASALSMLILGIGIRTVAIRLTGHDASVARLFRGSSVRSLWLRLSDRPR